MIFTLLSMAALAVSAPPGWRTYANPRFDYSICYPADLVPQPVADNGDGRSFVGAGAKLSVWGSNNALDDTVTSAAARDKGRIAKDGGRLSYQAVRGDWYVLSARQGSQIVYLKSRLVGDHFVTFELRYPASAAARWNPRVAALGKCLTVGNAG